MSCCIMLPTGGSRWGGSGRGIISWSTGRCLPAGCIGCGTARGAWRNGCLLCRTGGCDFGKKQGLFFSEKSVIFAWKL